MRWNQSGDSSPHWSWLKYMIIWIHCQGPSDNLRRAPWEWGSLKQVLISFIVNPPPVTGIEHQGQKAKGACPWAPPRRRTKKCSWRGCILGIKTFPCQNETWKPHSHWLLRTSEAWRAAFLQKTRGDTSKLGFLLLLFLSSLLPLLLFSNKLETP